MKFRDYVTEKKIVAKLNMDGDKYELSKEFRWGGVMTHVIYKNGKEVGQMPPNLKPEIAKKIFKSMDFKDDLYESVTEIENFITDNLKKGVKTTPERMFKSAQWVVKKIKQHEFDEAWQNLVDDGILKKKGENYVRVQ